MAAQQSIVRLAGISLARFLGLVSRGAIRRRHDRIGQQFAIEQGGVYRVFRETVSEAELPNRSAVLVVGFRLRLVRSIPVLHWIFQRVCILTTPFWSGFRGFHVKLWMVDPTSKNYLGIYDWSGEHNARLYAETLVRVLHPLSTRNSVWYRVYPDQELDPFLHARAQRPAAGEVSPRGTVAGAATDTD